MRSPRASFIISWQEQGHSGTMRAAPEQSIALKVSKSLTAVFRFTSLGCEAPPPIFKNISHSPVYNSKAKFAAPAFFSLRVDFICVCTPLSAANEIETACVRNSPFLLQRPGRKSECARWRNRRRLITQGKQLRSSATCAEDTGHYAPGVNL